MAYAAVTSLMHTIRRFSESDDLEIVQNSSPEMIKLLEEEARSLANVLIGLDTNTRRFSSKRLNALDSQITEAVFKLEDVLEFHLLHQFASQSEIHQHPLTSFFLDIEELKPDIDSLIQTVNKMKAEYSYELSTNNMPIYEKKEEEDFVFKSEPIIMFGILSNQVFEEIRDMIMFGTLSKCFTEQALWGMAGVGKTTFARKLVQDPVVLRSYDGRCAFVTVGPEYQLEDVLLDILKQLDRDTTDHQRKLRHFQSWFKVFLKDGNCLIVLDDVWDNRIPEFLSDSYHGNKGSFTCNILITTRLGKLFKSLHYKTIPFMDKKGSWDLLCAKVFGEDSSSCTPQLERAGKKIAENCEGLPLTIVTVANILSKLERTPELWNKVAANKQHSVYVEAYAQMHKVLLPSYYCLPQYLRISFLYMGVFLQNYEIPCNKLLMLWAAEGFIRLEESLVHADRYKRFYIKVAEGKYSVYKDHFRKLVINSVLIVLNTATIVTYKTVSLHSSFWYMCKKEASKSKFFHSFTTLDDCSVQGIETQRRLCIYNPVLFAIKDAFNKMASVSAARSLLCTGMYHPYPVPICLGLRLLRVLDALTIHFYEFPMEVLKLIHLIYFALTCNGDLPSSIPKLWNLVYLIVNRRLSIKSSAGAPSYLPVEIWDMKNLEHLQVLGSDLPEPREGSLSLVKLSKLLDVSPHSCTKRILERFPNLTKLRIRVELSPDDAVDQPLGCFDHIHDSRYLRSFKCVVVNPRIMFEVVAPPPVPLPIFPQGLLKLTLSGLGYPWEEMSKISSLPKLTVLKLMSYAFLGPKWDIQDKEFPSLEVLVIEETDLVQWTIEDDYHTECLRLLSIKHCYNLEEMPMDLSGCLKKIEVVDCNPLVVNCANQLKENSDRKYHFFSWVDLNVHSSWDDQN